VVLIGDGQVSLGPTIVKPNARKIRKIGEGVVAGFAGSAADGLSLLERLEVKLEEHPGERGV
jgi:ATP-dependent HslUV protease subunit HslV